MEKIKNKLKLICILVILILIAYAAAYTANDLKNKKGAHALMPAGEPDIHRDDEKKSDGVKDSGDEIPELLICAVEENGADFSCGSEILAAYTCADKMPQYCFEGWSRSSYHYLGDGEFFYQGSGGAMYSMFGVYTLSQDGSGLSCEDYYFTFEKNEGSTEIGFYHNTSGAWDKSLSQELSITSELFWQMAAVFEDQIQSIPLIPFSAYEG